MDTQVLRSERKTICLKLTPDGLLVKAPRQMSDSDVEKFIHSHQEWIKRAYEREQQRLAESAHTPPLTHAELQDLAEKALAFIPGRARYYAPKVGVSFGRITIRNQKTRWGSCSGNGNLNFNCLLMLTPPEVIDSVVVHELCHRKQMNHSEAFYREVLRVFPDYWAQDQWLKKHGPAILRRMCP